MQTSAIKDIDVNTIRATARKGELTTKCLSLNIGQGFEVQGKGREELAYAIAQAKREGMQLGTKKLGQLHFLIFRYA